jgi:peptide/nickel transport system substrate-binding protein
MKVSGSGQFTAAWSRTLRRRRLLQAGIGGGAALALGACGTKNQSGAPSALSPTSSGGPRAGGTLNVGIPADPYSWDPTYAGVGSGATYHLVYSTLLSYKHGPGVPFSEPTLQPELASSWEVPDAQTFIFHLRKGVKLANIPPVSGRDLLADDVRFSLEYASRTGSVAAKKLPASVLGSFFEGINSVETPDSSTVKVTFQAPFVPFINYIAAPYLAVLAHEVFEQDGHFKDRPVGSGPFQLDTTATQKGTRWVFKKNLSYWDAGKPYIDQVNMVVLADGASAQAAFRARQLDLLDTGVDQTSVDTISKANPTVVKYETIDPAPQHLYMSVKPGSPLADIRMRQAIGLALDRNEYLKTLYNGKGGWSMAGAFPDTYSQDEIHAQLKQDVKEARQLVATAGHPDGIEIEFIYPGNYFGQIYITQMQLLQAQLKQVGINLRLKPMDYSTYSTLKKQHNFTITNTHKSLQGDIDSYLNNSFNPALTEDYTEVNDPDLTKLLLAQRQETDATTRRETCRQAVKRINVEQVWALGVFEGLVWNLWQPRLQNYAPHFGLTLTLDNAWLKD